MVLHTLKYYIRETKRFILSPLLYFLEIHSRRIIPHTTPRRYARYVILSPLLTRLLSTLPNIQ